MHYAVSVAEVKASAAASVLIILQKQPQADYVIAATFPTRTINFSIGINIKTNLIIIAQAALSAHDQAIRGKAGEVEVVSGALKSDAESPSPASSHHQHQHHYRRHHHHHR